jgi:carbon-monoxide dehydrogenase catalytic subunit
VIDTVFDRAVNMKQCNIGTQGTCCKNCGMGPCRLPLPKSGIEGEDTRKGLCGATANTIAARNFIRMIAGGAAAHSDHGRGRGRSFPERRQQGIQRLPNQGCQQIAGHRPLLLTWPPPLRLMAKQPTGPGRNRMEVAEKAIGEWGKSEGELLYLKRAPSGAL